MLNFKSDCEQQYCLHRKYSSLSQARVVSLEKKWKIPHFNEALKIKVKNGATTSSESLRRFGSSKSHSTFH